MSVHNTPDTDHETDEAHQEAIEDELDANEPHTPGWLTLLGCGLFLAVGIFVVATDEPVVAALTPAAEEAQVAAPQAAAQPAAAPPQPAAAPAARDPQAARAAAQKLIEQLKLRQAPGGAGIQPPQPSAQ